MKTVTYQVEIDHPALGIMTGQVCDSHGITCALRGGGEDASLELAARELAQAQHAGHQGAAQVRLIRTITETEIIAEHLPVRWCGECGTEIPPGAPVCGACGKDGTA